MMPSSTPSSLSQAAIMRRLRIATLSAVMALGSFSAGMLFQVWPNISAVHFHGAAPRHYAVIIGGKRVASIMA